MNDATGRPVGAASITLASLHVYPIKGCAGVALPEALIVETGLEFDRAWMVVDAHGRGLGRRELPGLAAVALRLKHSELVLRAPGMIALHVALDRVEQPVRVRLGPDDLAAYDMGDLCAQWFTDLLRALQPSPTSAPEVVFPLRVARFDPAQRRLADRDRTGGIEAELAFADAYPLQVVGQASLDERARRSPGNGDAADALDRLRPHLVLDGLAAGAEATLDEIAFATADGPIRLKRVAGLAPCGLHAVVIEGTERAVHAGLKGWATAAVA